MPSSRASEDQAAQAAEQSGAPADATDAPQRPDAPDAPDAPEAQPDLSAELARMEDRYKRALADLDNYRKRSARDLERRVEERRDALLRDWLEVVDGVERALRQVPEGALRDGLRAVLDQMESTLARQGVQRIGAVGEPFDPARHEAIDVRETGTVPDRTVVDVLRSGFAIDGRVLRPAQVAVARSPREA
jgi:molecular chaperone GrpE